MQLAPLCVSPPRLIAQKQTKVPRLCFANGHAPFRHAHVYKCRKNCMSRTAPNQTRSILFFFKQKRAVRPHVTVPCLINISTLTYARRIWLPSRFSFPSPFLSRSLARGVCLPVYLSSPFTALSAHTGDFLFGVVSWSTESLLCVP